MGKVIEDSSLIDLGLGGHQFTWSNKRSGKKTIQKRLDHGIVNATLRVLFPKAFVVHLPAIDSGHNPILLNTNPSSNMSPLPFRFESIWVHDPSSSTVVENAWPLLVRGPPMFQFYQKIGTTKSALRCWNRNSFGHFQLKIQHLKKDIDSLQYLD